MSILTGFKKFYKHIKTSDNTYQRVSEWTDSSTVNTGNNKMLNERLLLHKNSSSESDIETKGNILTTDYVTYNGVCTTSGYVSTKVATISMLGNNTVSEFKLYNGCTIDIKFTYDDTSVNPLQLKVNDTAFIPVYYKGVQCEQSHLLKSNIIYTFKFDNSDGTSKWIIIGDIDGTGSSSTSTSVFTGATESANGTIGLVPMPLASKDCQFKILTSDADWVRIGSVNVDVGATSAINISCIIEDKMSSNSEITFNLTESRLYLIDANYENRQIANISTHLCKRISINKISNNEYYWEYNFLIAKENTQQNGLVLEKRCIIGGYDSSRAVGKYYVSSEEIFF